MTPRFDRARILGIVNITADSFSDGGKYLDPGNAILHARALIAAGADIIDLGPASSHPDAQPVTAAQEIARLVPVVAALSDTGIALSIDSFQPETQLYAVRKNISYINDIQGFPDPEIYPDLARSDCKLIVMHSVQSQGGATRVATDVDGLYSRIAGFFETRLLALTDAGISKDRIILDPGMGFFLGNVPDASLSILGKLRQLKQRFGLPMLISVSRKSFLQQVSGAKAAQAGAASLAAELYAAFAGADYIRTHDAGSLRQGLAVWSALRKFDTNLR